MPQAPTRLATYLVSIYSDGDPIRRVLTAEKAEALVEAGFGVTLATEQHLTHALAARELREHTGLTVILKPHEYVINMRLDPTQAGFVVAIADLRELRTGFTVQRVGTRMYSFGKTESGKWVGTTPITIWDEEHEPYFMRTFGSAHTSLIEWREQVAWERDCARPGTAAFPLDTYQKALVNPNCTPDRIHRHWK